MATEHDMQQSTSRSYRATGAVAATSASGSRTARGTGPVSGNGGSSHSSDGLAAQVAALPSPLRLQMQLIAQQSSGPDDALVPIIDLLVADGSAPKRAAIVTAYRTHEALRLQWERTWEILRSS